MTKQEMKISLPVWENILRCSKTASEKCYKLFKCQSCCNSSSSFVTAQDLFRNNLISKHTFPIYAPFSVGSG